MIINIIFICSVILHHTTAEYECNEPLLDRAVLSATSSLRERGAKSARLNGGSTWTASSSDFEQHLIMDLGQTMRVMRIESQGRPHSSEYVMEYAVSYGSNGLDYADYKEPGGNVKVRRWIGQPVDGSSVSWVERCMGHPVDGSTVRWVNL